MFSRETQPPRLGLKEDQIPIGSVANLQEFRKLLPYNRVTGNLKTQKTNGRFVTSSENPGART